MPQTSDDLDAVRAIVKALEPFEADEQDRIIRWAKEKLGLSLTAPVPDQPAHPRIAEPVQSARSGKTIREFLNLKQPKSDNNLAATVAYYYRFEAAENERREFITKEDLLNACRLAEWERPNHPGQVLVNSQGAGLLDKGPEKGSYVINSVGENLVAVTLPTGATPRAHKKSSRRSKK